MTLEMPAISLTALPGRRNKIIEIAKESEERVFAGIYLPSLGDNIGLAAAIAVSTKQIVFGTSICPIYFRSTLDLVQAAAFIHEVSNGRFRFGIEWHIHQVIRDTVYRCVNRSQIFRRL